jgi:Cu(I)/Ag(I) efflux system membrane fusion protein
MSSNHLSGQPGLAVPGPVQAEGPPLSRWQKFRLVIKVVELRLRFIALMAITGLVFAYWDTIWNRYEKWMRPVAEQHAAVSGVEYYCPMHPQVVQDEPGSCPICGMPLARRKKGEKAILPAGVTARVQLAPSRVAQAGIDTVEVAYTPLTQSVTAVGYVAYDERRLATIASKVPGKSRIVKLYANYTGMDVEAGQTLAELYSPELYQAFQELITVARPASGDTPQVRPSLAQSLGADAVDLVRLASEKLKRWGITQAQIDEVLKTGKAGWTVPVLSPIGGHLVSKNVKEGQEVPESFPMFEVADLRTVWVQAQIFENQLDLIHEGQAVEATVDALPGRTFSGTVEFVQPHVDPLTRTVEVRYSLDNPEHKLRPGLYATVVLKTPVAEMPLFKTRLAATPRTGSAIRPASLSAEEQKTCPVTSAKLGVMGDPVPVEVEGRKIWTCCKECPPKLKAQPAKYLARLAPPPQDQVLSVPESAVIDTGKRKVVYVETEPGNFDGREVLLGPRIGDRFPVLEGLAPGERVAADGAFLIDAESRINPGPAPTQPRGPSTLEKSPARTGDGPPHSAHRH